MFLSRQKSKQKLYLNVYITASHYLLCNMNNKDMLFFPHLTNMLGRFPHRFPHSAWAHAQGVYVQNTNCVTFFVIQTDFKVCLYTAGSKQCLQSNEQRGKEEQQISKILADISGLQSTASQNNNTKSLGFLCILTASTNIYM